MTVTTREKQVAKKKRKMATNLSRKYKQWLLKQNLEDIDLESKYAMWAKNYGE